MRESGGTVSTYELRDASGKAESEGEILRRIGALHKQAVVLNELAERLESRLAAVTRSRMTAESPECDSPSPVMQTVLGERLLDIEAMFGGASSRITKIIDSIDI